MRTKIAAALRHSEAATFPVAAVKIDKLAAAWHAAHGAGLADDATETEKIAAIASARAGLSRADQAESSEPEVAAATDAADTVIAACRPRTLAGNAAMVSLMIQAGGATFIDHALLAGLENIRSALVRLAGLEPVSASNIVSLKVG